MLHWDLSSSIQNQIYRSQCKINFLSHRQQTKRHQTQRERQTSFLYNIERVLLPVECQLKTVFKKQSNDEFIKKSVFFIMKMFKNRYLMVNRLTLVLVTFLMDFFFKKKRIGEAGRIIFFPILCANVLLILFLQLCLISTMKWLCSCSIIAKKLKTLKSSIFWIKLGLLKGLLQSREDIRKLMLN